MSILVPVSDLVERIQLDCGLPEFTTNTAITSAAVLDFVKRGAQKLAGLVQSAGAGEQYLSLTTSLTTTAGVPTVSLPSNTQDVLRVGWMYDGDREIQLSVASIDAWDSSEPNWGVDAVPTFRVMGNTLMLFPTPQSVKTINLFYTVGFSVTSTSDILALRESWDEFIVAEANIMVRNRLEKACPEFLMARDEARSAVVSQLRRDRAGIRQVRDVRCGPFDFRGNSSRWRYR